MKVTVEYGNDEIDSFMTAMKVSSFHNVIYDLKNYLRACIKYGEFTDEQCELFDQIQDKLIQSLQDNDVLNEFY